MTNQFDLAKLLFERILERTFVTINEQELEFRERVIAESQIPNSERTLADKANGLYITLMEKYGVPSNLDSLAEERRKLRGQQQVYARFKKEHGKTLEYLAALASNSKPEPPVPSEVAVQNILYGLDGVTIMGEVIPGFENTEATYLLEEFVVRAAVTFAKIKGTNPAKYLLPVEEIFGNPKLIDFSF